MATIHKITTTDTLVEDLRGSLNERGVSAGITVGEFFAAVLAFGIRMNDPLGSIEYGISQQGTGRIVVERDDQDAWEIREKR